MNEAMKFVSRYKYKSVISEQINIVQYDLYEKGKQKFAFLLFSNLAERKALSFKVRFTFYDSKKNVLSVEKYSFAIPDFYPGTKYRTKNPLVFPDDAIGFIYEIYDAVYPMKAQQEKDEFLKDQSIDDRIIRISKAKGINGKVSKAGWISVSALFLLGSLSVVGVPLIKKIISENPTGLKEYFTQDEITYHKREGGLYVNNVSTNIINIPSEINSVQVVGIESNAFEGRNLEAVYAYSPLIVESSAFLDCTINIVELSSARLGQGAIERANITTMVSNEMFFEEYSVLDSTIGSIDFNYDSKFSKSIDIPEYAFSRNGIVAINFNGFGEVNVSDKAFHDCKIGKVIFNDVSNAVYGKGSFPEETTVNDPNASVEPDKPDEPEISDYFMWNGIGYHRIGDVLYVYYDPYLKMFKYESVDGLKVVGIEGGTYQSIDDFGTINITFPLDIQYNAFWDCNISALLIEQTCTFQEKAFSSCNIESLKCEADLTVSSNAFSLCDCSTIYFGGNDLLDHNAFFGGSVKQAYLTEKATYYPDSFPDNTLIFIDGIQVSQNRISLDDFGFKKKGR